MRTKLFFALAFVACTWAVPFPVAAAGGHEASSVEAQEHANSPEHGDGHGHVPHFQDINWIYGLLGEKEGVEPNLLFRPKGMPIPLGALILNTAILFFLIGRFGGSGIKKGLVGRRERIVGSIEQASKMKSEASTQLAHYEDQLAQMAQEMERIKKEMKHQADADRDKIVAEAKARRESIEKEARSLIEQELAQARYDATIQAVTGALELAREKIANNLGASDHERLAQDLLSDVGQGLQKSKEVQA